MIRKSKLYLYAYTFILITDTLYWIHICICFNTHLSHSITVTLEYTSTPLFTNKHHYITSVYKFNPIYIIRLYITVHIKYIYIVAYNIFQYIVFRTLNCLHH